MKRKYLFKSFASAPFAAGMALFMAASASAQTEYFWNGANTSASPAAGGTGTWTTTNAWRTASTTGSQASWAAGANTHNATFAGTAGTVTLGSTGSSNFQGTNMTVNTNGYIFTTSSASRNMVFTGGLTLANSVGITVTNSGSGGNLNSWGSISFGTGASLTVSGGASVNNANRVNLTGAGLTTSGGSITLAGTGDGTTGFVSTASAASGGHTLNTNITNNSSTSATMLGATGSNLLIYGGQISGSANLQISAGQSGGAGIVTLSNTNSFTGNTYTNSATNGVLRIGVNNALPSGTTVFMGQSAGGGTADSGGSIDLNGFNLAIGALDAASSTRGVANNTTTLSTLTIGKASGSNTFGGIIGTVTNSTLTTQSNNIALVKTGASRQVLTGANTYTGTTTVNAGVLEIGGSGSINSSSSIAVAAGAKFVYNSSTALTKAIDLQGSVSSAATLSGTGTINASITLNSLGDVLDPGNSPGIQNFGVSQSWESFTYNWELNDWAAAAAAGTNFDQIGITGSLNLTGSSYQLNILSLAANNLSGLVGSGGGVAFSETSRTWTILTTTDGISGFDANQWTLNTSGFTDNDLGSWNLARSGNSLVLSYTAIPEPSVSLIGGLGVLALLRRRRRA